MPYTYQSLNNCGPQSIASVLGYYGVRIDQQSVARATKLEPDGYMAATAIAQFVAQYGLEARRFVGGHREHVQALLQMGVPVIVLQWLQPDSNIPHYRVVTGYDNISKNFLALDPLLGPAILISYPTFDVLWKSNRAQFIPVYPVSYRNVVRKVLGVS